MVTLTPKAGDSLYGVLSEAVEKAPATFKFNDWSFETRVGETLGDARQRFKDQHGFDVLTDDESAERARVWLEKTRRDQEAAIANAHVATEEQMREMEAPNPRSIGELSVYIEAMVERPHDYGTCVYAMSLAAVAAFNYVAHRLGVSGFQASCADMDILRQTRDWKCGKILNYDDLLYPQYCDAEHFPSHKDLLAQPEIRERLRMLAMQQLEDSPHAAPAVLRHWKKLAAYSPAITNEDGWNN